ncbi:type VI secretion system-associated FHA domain protein TagH [Mixta theicola]|uniref:Type VI secretion system-associated FHA domain protein TagH n=1 Tax=Mixta theicola TaxID=1458355 RepID=A0A2K1Q567_9GAMM|nr:type VI secretion system-associated FHA domain protein TagH [Mixta theicola]PNS10107.1 type VI secretion system-associated FHA domain protein TagH [Mixta theicola]GLR08540.1 phosphopeptide-binding protein [Mixta theicola]
MRFTIITNKPGHQPPQSSCDFLPPGGTIGRGVDNNLVLPDNDRTISRLQAIVHITADGECRITNRGNVTRVELNDIPLERGRQVELQDGDILGIDEYRLLVNELSAAAQPVAQAAAPAFRPAPQAPAAQPAQPAKAAEGTAAIPSEIWDSLAKEFSISDSISANRVKSAAPAGDAHPLTTPTTENRNPEDPLAQFKTSEPLSFDRRSQAPDALFEKDELFKSNSIFNDSTPTTLVQPVAGKAAQPKAKDELDPLALFGGGNATPAQLNSDDPLGLMMGSAVPLAHPDDEASSAQQAVPAQAVAHPAETGKQELFGSDDDIARSPLFADELPQAADLNSGAKPVEDTFSASPLLADEPPATQDADFNDAVKADDNALSASPLFADLPADKPNSIESSPLFNQPPRQPETPDYGGITLPTPQAVQRNVTPPPKGRLRIDPVASTSSQPYNLSSGGETLQGELLQALLDGMGLNDMQPTPHFDRENMQQLGQMLGMFSQGTVALLSSRSILKRGVKADMTVILDDANNPFKLLPSGKTVLMQMFGSRMPGFMPPKQAVRDALVDLQAHQLGMIAGIRAIIAAMLQSFNPQQLEEEARQEGVTSRLSLPGSRKAALWEHFNRRYNETAGEIEDDFHTLFGEAFLHAYDMEVNQYKDSQTASDE